MSRAQGRYFTENEINRIRQLLADTDMTIPEIAARMDCARSSIAAINRRLQIRNYGGARAYWDCNSQNLALKVSTQ